MRFREHRGNFDASFDTMVTLPPTRKALLDHCRKILFPWGFEFDDHSLEVEMYVPNPDPRFDPPWRQTYIVTIKGYGVMGFTDVAT